MLFIKNGGDVHSFFIKPGAVHQPAVVDKWWLSGWIPSRPENFKVSQAMHRSLASLLRSPIIVAVAAVCCVACSRSNAAHVQGSASPKPVEAVAAARVTTEPAVETSDADKTRAAELMQAIFGAHYRTAEGAALIDIEGGDDAGYWRMTLYAARNLPDGRTAVVVNGAPSDEKGADNSAHASAGMLNVYTLRRTEGAWQVLQRYQDVGTMGSSGNIGVVKWIVLGPDKPGIVVSSGGTWFGSTIANAEIFNLDDGMHSLGGFAELSTNAGGCMPETEDCWDVAGTMSTVRATHAENYRDIVVDFARRHFRVTESDSGKYVEHVTRTVRQTARYRFDGKAYVLVSGENPVPAIDG